MTEAQYCLTCLKPYPDQEPAGRHEGHDIVTTTVKYICMVCGNQSLTPADIPIHAATHVNPGQGVAHWHYFDGIYPPLPQ